MFWFYFDEWFPTLPKMLFDCSLIVASVRIPLYLKTNAAAL